MQEINLLFSDLIKRLNCDKTIGENARIIIKKLCDYRLINKTEFEFSLRIVGGDIENSFRFVNFDNYSNTDISAYEERLELIEDLFFSIQKDRHITNSFLRKQEIHEFRLPIYFGLDAGNDDMVFKIYLNFSHIKDLSLRQDISKKLLIQLNWYPVFKKRPFPLIGLDISQNDRIGYKIYYLYDNKKEKWYLNRYNFSKHENILFDFLNNFNKNNYFVIAERYKNNECFSKKIEVGIKRAINQCKLIGDLLQLNNTYHLRKDVLDIIKFSKGYVNVIIIEKRLLTIYIRIPNTDNDR